MPARPNPSRRNLLRGHMPPTREIPPWRPRPPWTRRTALQDACTGCGRCAEACPESIIALAEDGLPYLNFALGECTFCGECAAACPEPVFAPAHERAPPAFHHVAEIGADCFAAHGIVCQSCGDACPEGAIRFTPRIGAPPLPRLDPLACTGCGACVAACPGEVIACRPFEPAAGRDG